MQALSIVTVCFNDAEALVPTIRSITGQDSRDFQYVIQDGGSTDGTAAVVKGFGDWIDVFNSEPDAGIYQAMNRAVLACTGRYTLFINAADYLFSSTTLSEIVGHLRGDDDILTGRSMAAETGKIHPFRPPDRFWSGMTFDHQAAIVRTDLLRRNPYDERLRISGDFDFFSRMRKAGAKFRAIDQVICRKPYSVGVSASFIDRFRERYGIALRHFGDVHPVQETLRGELVQHITATFDAEVLAPRMEKLTVEELLALHDKLAALTRVRPRPT